MRLKIITASIIACLFSPAYSVPMGGETTTIPKVNLSSCQKPEYPKPSLAANETGAVVVSLHVSKEGRVLETRLESSSGHPLLDSATTSAFSQCDFTPASVDGIAVDSWTRMKFIWRTE
ncbi:energy transducer TonB [Collimonas arenae]|uniref:energy transducer TonB n=1 Tax=Collimonas arenae TaxID=279058 RepID=UPI0009EE5592